jgi:hypothetical protein
MKRELVICRRTPRGDIELLVRIPRVLFVVLHILLSKMLQQVQANTASHSTQNQYFLHTSLNIHHSANFPNMRFKQQ